ncbi:MAG: hypothetical protein COA79_10225 [Planctomycetota bacterium]|nr:MAG: hypothetical protein COA79_10225 [Planctomycetota bacterium]
MDASNDSAAQKKEIIKNKSDILKPLDNTSLPRVQIANTRELKVKAFRLLYESYLEKGFAQESESKMWYSIFDLLPDTAIVVAINDEDEVVGALTIVLDSEIGLPADELCKGELEEFRKGHTLAQIASLCVKGKVRSDLGLLIKLCNYAFLYAKGLKSITDFIITVNPKNMNFYIQKLLFAQIGQEGLYSKLGGNPAVILQLDLEEAELVSRQLRDEPSKHLYDQFYNVSEKKDDFDKLFETKMSMNCSTEDFGYFVNQNCLMTKAVGKDGYTHNLMLSI